jgi:hypothetical protein
MSPRARLLTFVAIVVVAVAGAVWYVVGARNEHKAANRTGAADAPQTAAADVAAVAAAPHLVFRSTALGDGYGRLALVALTDPAGPRAFAPSACERVYSRASVSVCLVAERGLVTRYHADVLDGKFAVAQRTPVAGLPSRARISPDGSLMATTTFVSGDSYASPGTFSTRTVVGPVNGGESVELESFKLVINGKTVNAADRNLWGVTFTKDDNGFFATAATGGKTYLVRGDLSARTLTSIREDVECPSLSPDGTRIAFKKHGSLPAGQWRLAVYDLASGKETVLAETHSVDDQAEWLDASTVLYGLPRTGQNGAATSDVWAVAADGSGAPRVLVENAWSPSVVR